MTITLDKLKLKKGEPLELRGDVVINCAIPDGARINVLGGSLTCNGAIGDYCELHADGDISLQTGGLMDSIVAGGAVHFTRLNQAKLLTAKAVFGEQLGSYSNVDSSDGDIRITRVGKSCKLSAKGDIEIDTADRTLTAAATGKITFGTLGEICTLNGTEIIGTQAASDLSATSTEGDIRITSMGPKATLISAGNIFFDTAGGDFVAEAAGYVHFKTVGKAAITAASIEGDYVGMASRLTAHTGDICVKHVNKRSSLGAAGSITLERAEDELMIRNARCVTIPSIGKVARIHAGMLNGLDTPLAEGAYISADILKKLIPDIPEDVTTLSKYQTHQQSFAKRKASPAPIMLVCADGEKIVCLGEAVFARLKDKEHLQYVLPIETQKDTNYAGVIETLAAFRTVSTKRSSYSTLPETLRGSLRGEAIVITATGTNAMIALQEAMKKYFSLEPVVTGQAPARA